MAAPQDESQGQEYAQPDPYDTQSSAQAQYATSAESPPPVGHEGHEGGKKKKRGYAAQAYDFGAGANSALGGQVQGGGQFPAALGAPVYDAYGSVPQAAAYGAPQYGAQVGGIMPGAPAPGYGAPAQYGGVGYQAPDAGYPGPGGAPSPDVAGVTQGMGQMGFNGQPGQPQAPGAAGRPPVLNQLYPTDLLNQPFNVAELELPPPPIILPANVSYPENP